MNTEPFGQTDQMIELSCEYLSIRCILLCIIVYYYVFQSELSFYIPKKVKELLALNKRNIWRLSDYNWIWNHNHLFPKQTLNNFSKLTKWLSWVVSTYLYGAFDCILFSCHVRISEWIYTIYLPECHGTPSSKQVRFLEIKWLQLDSNLEPLSS